MTTELTNENIITLVKTDPYNAGIAALIAVPGYDLQALIDLLNDRDSLGAGPVAADPISKTDLYGMINSTNLVAMNSQQIGLWGMIPDTVKIGESGTQANLNAIFSGFTATLSNFTAAYTQVGSAWERYFGTGLVATTSLINEARGFGPDSPNF